ncbi:helix-turn-helix transcriptional regulator [Negadavirga shengliensis]|uniref:Helix-turn-helix transcriptional regulator n=1 Tax=Negadavirga shengliensis TaxID=1389218 RepID=A0ABV9SZC3_9BACT
MEQDQIIGKNLQVLRQKMALTQEQVADYLQINREEVSYYENGKRSMPSSLLSKIANLFGVDEYDLFEEDMGMARVNLALAFRADTLDPEDLEQIAGFKKIVMNYLRMKTVIENESANT